MKKLPTIFLLLLLSIFSMSQSSSSPQFLGNYVFIKSNKVLYIVTIGLYHFEIYLTDPKERTEYKGDIIFRDYNYEGSWEFQSDTI